MGWRVSARVVAARTEAQAGCMPDLLRSVQASPGRHEGCPVSRRLFGGERVPDVHVFGQTLDIWIRPRAAEIDRRTGLGVGAMLDEGMVRALMTIPEGASVELRALDGAMLLEMDGLLENHAVDIVGDAARRRAIPPVDIVGFAKIAHDWSDVRGVTLLRTHGPRVAIASRPLAERILREVDPDVGVAVGTGSDCDVLRWPGVRGVRPSWQRWIIAEAAFEMWLQQVRVVGL